MFNFKQRFFINIYQDILFIYFLFKGFKNCIFDEEIILLKMVFMYLKFIRVMCILIKIVVFIKQLDLYMFYYFGVEENINIEESKYRKLYIQKV